MIHLFFFTLIILWRIRLEVQYNYLLFCHNIMATFHYFAATFNPFIKQNSYPLAIATILPLWYCSQPGNLVSLYCNSNNLFFHPIKTLIFHILSLPVSVNQLIKSISKILNLVDAQKRNLIPQCQKSYPL